MLDDPVRMYLMQMGQIPLLNRAQEIASAKEIERTRILYRNTMLGTDYLLQGALVGHGLISHDVLFAMLSEASILRASENLPRIVGLLSVEAWLRNLPRGVTLG